MRYTSQETLQEATTMAKAGNVGTTAARVHGVPNTSLPNKIKCEVTKCDPDDPTRFQPCMQYYRAHRNEVT